MRVERDNEEEESLNFSATAADADRLRRLERVGPHDPYSATGTMRQTADKPLSPAPVSAPAREESHVG